MRLPIISPNSLTNEQISLATDMREGITKSFQGFVNVRDDGALLGRGIPGYMSRNSGSRFGN